MKLDEMKNRVAKGKLYYNSYRNITDITCIGSIDEVIDDFSFSGKGFSTGIIVGQVKMIKSLKNFFGQFFRVLAYVSI